MSKLSPDMASVTRVGLDLAKTIFQVHAVDAAGTELDKRAIRMGKLIAYFELRWQCTTFDSSNNAAI